jgi:hypothetical protein
VWGAHPAPHSLNKMLGQMALHKNEGASRPFTVKRGASFEKKCPLVLYFHFFSWGFFGKLLIYENLTV